MTNFTAAMMNSQPFYLAATRQGHFVGRNGVAPTGEQDGSFAQMLMDGLNSVNTLERTAENLSVQAVVNPDSVDVHDVTIAAAKAEMALSITKNVLDRVIQAYREIQNLR
jgi:flagellar hook-basal body complex protein FliE